MSLEGQTGICVGHSNTIVNNLDEGSSGIFEYNLYVVGLSINGIFNQFFDDRGRALNHLASSNLVGH